MKAFFDNIKPMLALLIVVLSFTYFFVSLFKTDTVDPQVIIAIVGMVSAATAYYYGATTSSNNKPTTIEKSENTIINDHKENI